MIYLFVLVGQRVIVMTLNRRHKLKGLVLIFLILFMGNGPSILNRYQITQSLIHVSERFHDFQINVHDVLFNIHDFTDLIIIYFRDL